MLHKSFTTKMTEMMDLAKGKPNPLVNSSLVKNMYYFCIVSILYARLIKELKLNEGTQKVKSLNRLA